MVPGSDKTQGHRVSVIQRLGGTNNDVTTTDATHRVHFSDPHNTSSHAETTCNRTKEDYFTTQSESYVNTPVKSEYQQAKG